MIGAMLRQLLDSHATAKETPADLAAFRSATARNERVTAQLEREADVLADLVKSIKGPKPKRK